jgi:Tfp pilus assembly PilM family ATPase
MLNPFKDLFAPKSVLGLQVTDAFIAAVQIYNSFKGFEIDRVAFKEINGPSDHITEELRTFFQSENLRYETLVTCLPTRLAIVRETSLPFGNSRKLAKIIKYQIEPSVPYPIEDLVVDFLAPQADGKSITISIQKLYLQEHIAKLSEAGLDPYMITLDDLALFSLYLKDKEKRSEKPVAIINFSDGEMAIQITHKAKFILLRVLPRDSNYLDHLIKTFKLYHLNQPGVEIHEILLTGSSTIDENTSDQISALLKIKSSLWKPFDDFQTSLGPIAPELQAKLAVSLGLALSVQNSGNKLFNFRKEEFATGHSIDLKKSVFFMLSALLLLLFLFTFSTYQNLFVQQQIYNKLKNDILQQFSETFPDVDHVVKGQELAQMRQMIGEETSRQLWLTDLTHGPIILDTLMVLSKTISTFPSVITDNVSIEKDVIRVHGRSVSFEIVDQLKQKLSATGYFTSVKLVDAKLNKRAKTVEFNLVLEKKRES